MWKFTNGDEPIVATAIHSGHNIREELKDNFFITEADRLREEDPFTNQMTDISSNRILVYPSRFEVDMNRNRDKALYITPQDAWGLNVWKVKPEQSIINKSLSLYDSFYAELNEYCNNLRSKFGKFVVLDLHSYNHRRNGENTTPDDPEKNPEIIVGTSNMETSKWEHVISCVESEFQKADYFGRNLDVRRNVKYSGGNFSQWIHNNFPDSACVLSIEFKKIFMNEWTGELDKSSFNRLHEILRSAKQAVMEVL